MAGFEFFNQIQGHALPISLFGDAALQGAQLGHQTPSIATSVIRGVQEGVAKGQQTYLNYQQGKINQQTIEANENRLPAIEAQSELAARKAEDELAAIERNEAPLQETADTQAKINLEQARVGLQTVENAGTVAEQEVRYNAIMQTGNTAEMFKATYGGEFTALFQAKPKLFEMGQAAVYMQPGLNDVIPGAKERIEDLHTINKIKTGYATEQVARLKELDAATKAIEQNGAVLDIGSKLGGINPRNVPDRISLLEEGRYQVDANQNVILNPETGRPLANPTWTPNGKYIAVEKDPKTGKIVNGSILRGDITSAELTGVTKYVSTRDAYSGKYMQEDITNALAANQERRKAEQQAQLGGQVAGQVEAPVQEVSSDVARSTESNLNKAKTEVPAAVPLNDAEIKVVSKHIDMPDMQSAEVLLPPITKLRDLSTQAARKPVTARSPENLKEVSATKQDIINRMVQLEYEADPRLEDSITQDKIDAYNKSVEDAFYVKYYNKLRYENGYSPRELATFTFNWQYNKENYTGAFRVKDKLGYYAVMRQPVLERKVEQLDLEFRQMENARLSSPAQKAIQTRKNIELLHRTLQGQTGLPGQ